MLSKWKIQKPENKLNLALIGQSSKLFSQNFHLMDIRSILTLIRVIQYISILSKMAYFCRLGSRQDVCKKNYLLCFCYFICLFYLVLVMECLIFFLKLKCVSDAVWDQTYFAQLLNSLFQTLPCVTISFSTTKPLFPLKIQSYQMYHYQMFLLRCVPSQSPQ